MICKAPQNKIGINNLSLVYQMLFFLWVLRNAETWETSAQAARQTVKGILHLVSALHIPSRALSSWMDNHRPRRPTKREAFQSFVSRFIPLRQLRAVDEMPL